MGLPLTLTLGDDVRALFNSTEALFFLTIALIILVIYAVVTLGDLYRRMGAYMRTVNAIFTVIFTQEGMDTIKKTYAQLESIKASLAGVEETRRQAKSLIREATKPEGAQ